MVTAMEKEMSAMDNAIKEDILRDYFEAFSNKDVDVASGRAATD